MDWSQVHELGKKEESPWKTLAGCAALIIVGIALIPVAAKLFWVAAQVAEIESDMVGKRVRKNDFNLTLAWGGLGTGVSVVAGAFIWFGAKFVPPAIRQLKRRK
jgi:hypothetical protein